MDMNKGKIQPVEMIGHGNQDEVAKTMQNSSTANFHLQPCASKENGLIFKHVNKEADKQRDIIGEIWSDGVLTYGVPAGLAAITATFLMRYRQRSMKSTVVENVILHGLHYYGATSLGMAIGLALYKPTFEKKILERIPHSDLAREIRRDQSKRQ